MNIIFSDEIRRIQNLTGMPSSSNTADSGSPVDLPKISKCVIICLHYLIINIVQLYVSSDNVILNSTDQALVKTWILITIFFAVIVKPATSTPDAEVVEERIISVDRPQQRDPCQERDPSQQSDLPQHPDCSVSVDDAFIVSLNPDNSYTLDCKEQVFSYLSIQFSGSLLLAHYKWVPW